MSRGSFVSPETRSRVRALIEPLALAMSRAGLTPNMLTLIGFGIAVAGGLLAAIQLWLLAGIVATLGAAFDLFDGDGLVSGELFSPGIEIIDAV